MCFRLLVILVWFGSSSCSIINSTFNVLDPKNTISHVKVTRNITDPDNSYHLVNIEYTLITFPMALPDLMTPSRLDTISQLFPNNVNIEYGVFLTWNDNKCYYFFAPFRRIQFMQNRSYFEFNFTKCNFPLLEEKPKFGLWIPKESCCNKIIQPNINISCEYQPSQRDYVTFIVLISATVLLVPSVLYLVAFLVSELNGGETVKLKDVRRGELTFTPPFVGLVMYFSVLYGIGYEMLSVGGFVVLYVGGMLFLRNGEGCWNTNRETNVLSAELGFWVFGNGFIVWTFGMELSKISGMADYFIICGLYVILIVLECWKIIILSVYNYGKGKFVDEGTNEISHSSWRQFFTFSSIYWNLIIYVLMLLYIQSHTIINPMIYVIMNYIVIGTYILVTLLNVGWVFFKFGPFKVEIKSRCLFFSVLLFGSFLVLFGFISLGCTRVQNYLTIAFGTSLLAWIPFALTLTSLGHEDESSTISFFCLELLFLFIHWGVGPFSCPTMSVGFGVSLVGTIAFARACYMSFKN